MTIVLRCSSQSKACTAGRGDCTKRLHKHAMVFWILLNVPFWPLLLLLVDLCNMGGFQLTKWVSNSRTVLSSIEEEQRGKDIRSLDLDNDKLPTEHALGLQWNVEDDTFRFNIAVTEKPHTRRGILSMVSSVFDPLGILAPLTLPVKQFFSSCVKKAMDGTSQYPLLSINTG